MKLFLIRSFIIFIVISFWISLFDVFFSRPISVNDTRIVFDFNDPFINNFVFKVGEGLKGGIYWYIRGVLLFVGYYKLFKNKIQPYKKWYFGILIACYVLGVLVYFSTAQFILQQNSQMLFYNFFRMVLDAGSTLGFWAVIGFTIFIFWPQITKYLSSLSAASAGATQPGFTGSGGTYTSPHGTTAQEDKKRREAFSLLSSARMLCSEVYKLTVKTHDTQLGTEVILLNNRLNSDYIKQLKQRHQYDDLIQEIQKIIDELNILKQKVEACKKQQQANRNKSAMTLEDAYTIFNLTPKADKREMERRYNELALKMHPDKDRSNSEANKKMAELNAARDLLRDIYKKRGGE